MTDHPLSIDISFLFPEITELCGEGLLSAGDTAGDEMRHMGRVAGSALTQSNVIRGTFPASVVIPFTREVSRHG